MAFLPRVTVLFSNGNLLADISAIDGVAGMVGTVQTEALIGVVKKVTSLANAVEQGYTEDAEPKMYRQISEFFAELSGNQELYVMGTVDTMTMAQMLDKDDPEGAVKLIQQAAGKVRLLGLFRKPDAGYDAGEAFYDGDVEAACLASQAFGENSIASLIPHAILIEGRINDEDSLDIFEPKTADTDFGGVVVGGSLPDGSASVGTALGRACKYPAHIKLGKVANGPLAIDQVYIGTKLLKDYASLDALHGSGVISFVQHPQKAGFYFGIDYMANTGDYKRLAYRRVVDKAAVISVATYVEELEGEVDVDSEGKISDLDRNHLERRLEQQINNGMGEQISGVSVIIAADQNIIATSTLKVKNRIIPKGYTSFIDIDLGLNDPAA
jgi:hypothetical protein